MSVEGGIQTAGKLRRSPCCGHTTLDSSTSIQAIRSEIQACRQADIVHGRGDIAYAAHCGGGCRQWAVLGVPTGCGTCVGRMWMLVLIACPLRQQPGSAAVVETRASSRPNSPSRGCHRSSPAQAHGALCMRRHESLAMTSAFSNPAGPRASLFSKREAVGAAVTACAAPKAQALLGRSPSLPRCGKSKVHETGSSSSPPCLLQDQGVENDGRGLSRHGRNLWPAPCDLIAEGNAGVRFSPIILVLLAL